MSHIRYVIACWTCGETLGFQSKWSERHGTAAVYDSCGDIEHRQRSRVLPMQRVRHRLHPVPHVQVHPACVQMSPASESDQHRLWNTQPRALDRRTSGWAARSPPSARCSSAAATEACVAPARMERVEAWTDFKTLFVSGVPQTQPSRWGPPLQRTRHPWAL